MTNTLSDLESWVTFLGEKEIPVLRQTARSLPEMRTRAEQLNVREVAAVVLRDPLMTLRVLRYTARTHARRKLQDIATVEHAVMMLGVDRFFDHFAHFEVVEDRLKADPRALLGLLHVVRRAQRAGRYAWDWAVWRYDLNAEEVGVAALLHDLAEMLLWSFAPQQALQVQTLQKADSSLRSAEVQRRVFGFAMNELQTALCRQWRLPELLLSLMDDAQCERPRVKNVKLAVDLARHSAHGWDDPALPDDYTAIARLMNIDEDTLQVRLGLKQPDAGEDAAPAPSP